MHDFLVEGSLSDTVSAIIHVTSVLNEEVNCAHILGYVKRRPKLLIKNIWVRATLEKKLGSIVLAVE